MTAAMPSARPVLEVRGVTSGYGRTMVLRDVDLTVRAGSIDAVIGANGAGKTTLLRTVSGLIRNSSGSVLLNGQDVTHLPPHRRARIGMCLIPEGRGIFRNLNVRENLRLWVPPGSDARMDEVLEVFPVLRQRISQQAGTLSGGEQQMVALARCYLSAPSIVLLDEVSMGLAPRIIDQIFESLVKLAASGISLLLVEQYVNRALEMADNAHVMVRGRVSFSGRASELDEQTVLSGYLGADLKSAPNGSTAAPAG